MLVDFKFIYSYIYFFYFVKSFIDILYGKFCCNFLNRYYINIFLILFWFCNNFEDIGLLSLGRLRIFWRFLFFLFENRRLFVIIDINIKIFNKILNM